MVFCSLEINAEMRWDELFLSLKRFKIGILRERTSGFNYCELFSSSAALLKRLTLTKALLI